jgi:hypothetical protein
MNTASALAQTGAFSRPSSHNLTLWSGDVVELIEVINAEQSVAFMRDECSRLRHLAKHNTVFACFKCMDGRVHLPSITETPMGIITPFRAIGGKFSIFWPALMKRVRDLVMEAISKGARNVFLVTYHYSASKPALGCAGWKYQTGEARAHAENFAKDVQGVFEEQATVIVAGIETDTDELILHGPRGDVRGSSLTGLSEDEIASSLRSAFPSMDDVTLYDLLPFLVGNARHIQRLIAEPRELRELSHNERIVGVGQTFDWLVVRANRALVINDMDPNLDEAIVTAGRILTSNLERNPDGDAAIITNIGYASEGMFQRMAAARARGLMGFAMHHLREHNPDLLRSGRLRMVTGVTHEPTRKFTMLEIAPRRGS